MLQLALLLLLLFLPGYSVVRISGAQNKNIWLNAVLSYGVSLIIYILIGLFANTALPYYGINDPLSQTNLRYVFTGVIVSLWVLSICVKKFSFILPLSILNELNIYKTLLLILAPLPAIISIIGTLLLNNGQTNLISLLGLSLLTLQIILISFASHIFERKDNYLLYNLLFIAIGSVLMISMRGQFVSGSDIMLEHRMAEITQKRMLWVPDNPNHPYNACLSITILPAVLSNLSGVSLNILFKFVLQLSTILSVIPIFMVARKYVAPGLSYSASLAYITFPAFIGIMPMHLRQSSAMLFFFLSMYLILDNQKSYISRSFVYLFSVGLLISHYSTTYLAFAIYLSFFIGSLIVLVMSKLPWRGRIKEQYFINQSLFRYINPIFLCFMALTIYIWYFQVTVLSVGLTNFMQKLTLGFQSDTSLDIREDTSLKNQLNIFFKPSESTNISNVYLETVKREYSKNINGFFEIPQNEFNEFTLFIVPQSLIISKVDTDVLRVLLVGAELVKKAYKILTMIGVLYVFLTLFLYSKKKYETHFVIFLGIAISVLIMFTTLPFFSLDYDVFRTYHQLLIVLALMPVMGLLLFGKILKLPIQLVILLFFTVYFALSTGLFYELVGGYPESLVLRNSGDDFNRYYIRTPDVISSNWLMTNRELNAPIHTDTYTKHKLRYIHAEEIPIHDELTRLSLSKFSYVFLSTYHVTDKIAYKNFNNRLLKHSVDIKFIAEKKNKVYSNRSSDVYR